MRKHTGLIIAILAVGLVVAGCQDGADTVVPTVGTLDRTGEPITVILGDKHTSTCCVGIRGNVDNDPSENIDISDLVYLVDWLYHGGPAPVCVDEADMDHDHAVTSGDVDYLVDYMFNGGPAPVACN